MNACLCTVLALALAGPPPTRPTFTELEAKMQSHVEQERYAELAEQAERASELAHLTPEERRALAYFAVQGLHHVFEATFQPEAICHARRLLERLPKQVGIGTDAPILVRLKRDTDAKIAKLSRPCPTPRRSTTRRPAACPAVEVKAAEPEVKPEPETEASCPVEAVVPRPRVELLGADDPLTRAPAVPDAPIASPRLRLRGAIGGTLTALGLGALGAAAAGLGVMAGHAGTIREIAREPAAEQRPLTPAESQQIDAVYADAMSLRGPTIAAGALGTAALIAGIAVLASRRKLARRLAVTPSSGGLTLSGKF